LSFRKTPSFFAAADEPMPGVALSALQAREVARRLVSEVFRENSADRVISEEFSLNLLVSDSQTELVAFGIPSAAFMT
jgi:hypothetical protein